MKANNLIGKLAIRTKPVCLGRDEMLAEYKYDFSYTTSPIHILKVTDSHIVYDYKGTSEEEILTGIYILDIRFIDSNWENYEELIKIPKSKK